MQITVHGYAVSGGGRGIERVDVSFDGGKTWVEASRYQKTGIPYVADDKSSDKWAWVLFKAEAEISENTETVAKAVSYYYFLINIWSTKFNLNQEPNSRFSGKFWVYF